MKNYLGLLAIALCIVFTSCNKDDDSNIITEPTSEELINGDWLIDHLSYETEVDIPFLGLIPFNGDAENAGSYQVDSEAYTYVGDVDFMTEPMNIGGFDFPSVPVKILSEGTWSFNDDETELHLTSTEGVIQVYEVENLAEGFVLLRGAITYPFEFPGFEPMNLQVQLDLQMGR